MIVIERPRLLRRDGWTIVEAQVSGCDVTDRIWFGVEEPYAERLADVGPEPFVISLLPAAIDAGRDIVVKGTMSTRLFYNLENYGIPVLIGLRRRRAPRIHLHPEHLDGRRVAAAGVGTPVSGGIDSFTAIADHHLRPSPPGFQLTHLTYHNVGAHGRGSAGDRVFSQRRGTMERLAAELDLPLIAVNSNLHHFMRHRFQQSHTIRQIAAAQVLTGVLRRFVFASGVAVVEFGIHPGEPIGHADPALVHLLSTEALDCISHGTQYTRVEKTAIVSEIGLSRRYLDVCIEQDKATSGRPNCSVCKKCVRTMVTLEILGALDGYGEVFDLRAWRRSGPRKLGIVLGRDDGYGREIRALARARNYRFRPITRVFAAMWRAAYLLSPLQRWFGPIPARLRRIGRAAPGRSAT